MVRPESTRFVSYIRVSTDRQGRSGLGLEAQQDAVARYVASRGTVLVEFREIESGRKSDRPELAKALTYCREHKATLVIAKLDRLARESDFIIRLNKGDVDLAFCDFPTLEARGPAGKVFIGMLALFAEFEADMISQRTKLALAAAKARGTKLGGNHVKDPERRRQLCLAAAQVRSQNATDAYKHIAPVIQEKRAAGLTLRQIATHLNDLGITTRKRRPWNAEQVRRVLERNAA